MLLQLGQDREGGRENIYSGKMDLAMISQMQEKRLQGVVHDVSAFALALQALNCVLSLLKKVNQVSV